MGEEEVYKAVFEADADELVSESKRAGASLKKLEKSLGDVSRGMVRWGAAATAAIGGVIAQSLRAAASVEEMSSRFRVTFKTMSDQTETWAADYATQIGRSRFAMMRLAADYKVLLTAFGLQESEATAAAVSLTKLTSDWESFLDLPAADVMMKVSSGLAGEAEALRRVGVLVNETAIRQDALNAGLVTGTQEIDNLTKVKLRLRRILGGLSEAQGDATRTSRDLTNQWRALAGALEELNVDLGRVFVKDAKSAIEALANLVRDTAKWIRENESLVRTVGVMGLKISALVLSLGALGLAIIKVKAGILAVKAAFLATTGPIGIFVAALLAAGVGLAILLNKLRGPDGISAALDKFGEELDAVLTELDAFDAGIAAANEAAKTFGTQTLAQVSGALGRLGEQATILGTKLQNLIAVQNELDAAQANVAGAASDVAREFAKAPATEAGKALLDYKFLLEDIEKLWPEIATGSTEAMGEMSSMIRSISSLDVAGLAEAWAVSEEEARAALADLVAETTKATSDLIDMNKQVTDEMIKSVEERLAQVQGEVDELGKELLGLTMDIDITPAMSKIHEVEQQILALRMGVTAGPGRGTPELDRLSTASVRMHRGRSSSNVVNVNAPVSIARGEPPTAMAKVVAGEIHRMSRRGQVRAL